MVPVTSSAAARTRSSAWPMATPRAAHRSISVSLDPSPTAIVANGCTPSSRRTCSSALAAHPASNANDGWNQTESYWATDVRQDPAAWWQVDLEKPTNIGRVVVVLYYADTRHYGFTVQTSLDGKTWSVYTVATQTFPPGQLCLLCA